VSTPLLVVDSEGNVVGANEAATALLRAGADVRTVRTPVGDYVVVQLLPSTRAPPDKPLSAREREVLGLVAQGLSGPAISTRLGIGVSTVRSHVRNARAKLGARSRAEAVARALETGELE